MRTPNSRGLGAGTRMSPTGNFWVGVGVLGLGCVISLDPSSQVKAPNDPNDKPHNKFTLKSPFHFTPYVTVHKVLWSSALVVFTALICNISHFPQITFFP